jgi:hypothetical protein
MLFAAVGVIGVVVGQWWGGKWCSAGEVSGSHQLTESVLRLFGGGWVMYMCTAASVLDALR